MTWVCQEEGQKFFMNISLSITKDWIVGEIEKKLFPVKRQKQKGGETKEKEQRKTWRLCHMIDVIEYLPFKHVFQSLAPPDSLLKYSRWIRGS